MHRRLTRYLAPIGLLIGCSVWSSSPAAPTFTVKDDIELAHFGDPYTGKADAIRSSPDGKYFAVDTERGRIDLDRPEDTIRIYRTADVRAFLSAPSTVAPAPIWEFSRSTADIGPIICGWRWTFDSKSLAFLERTASGSHRLILADVSRQSLEELSQPADAVKAFDIRDRTHYVYAVADTSTRHSAPIGQKRLAINGTGNSLSELLFPSDRYPERQAQQDRSVLWAVVGGDRFQVKKGVDPVVLFDEGLRNLALSPDGSSLVTAAAVSEIPANWPNMYRPPFATYPYRIRTGPQDLQTSFGYRLIAEFVRIDLRAGSAETITKGPTSNAAGWWGAGRPKWSNDGQELVLPPTFLQTSVPSRPCVAVVQLFLNDRSCVEALRAQTENGYEMGYHYIRDVNFGGPNGKDVLVSFFNLDGSQGTTEYRRGPNGSWRAVASRRTTTEDKAGIKLSVKEGINERPVLVASDDFASKSKVLWDPNLSFQEISLGEASVYRWTDSFDRAWKGGLFKPPGYLARQRYPLVIQTHGFSEAQFRPSGVYPTAFAARALAGAGMIVLQVEDCPINATPQEGSCNVSGYESAVRRLVSDGLVDPDRIGIVGFSRTCYYVMAALTSGALKVTAASITDGVMLDYFQYMSSVDEFDNDIAREADVMIGARPFADGLQTWLKQSPEFNMERVTAPLQIVALGRTSLLFMWHPYAALRYLKKPVDLILLNSDEHVLTNPGARMSSQGGTVDWFRFWLQGYEDHSRQKADQYRRWESLCDAQAEQNPDRPVV